MKLIHFSIAVLLFSTTLFGQEQNTPDFQALSYNIHSPGDASISLSGNMIMNDPFGSQFAGGIKLRIFVSKKISFDTDLVFGKDYSHFGPGIFGLPLMLLGEELGSSEDGDDSNTMFFFKLATMLLSAEHISYHFPVKNTTDISPYISVLRFKQLKPDDVNVAPEEIYAHISFVAGIEINKYFKRFLLSPYAEYNIAYDGYFKGFNFGVNFGYYLPMKSK